MSNLKIRKYPLRHRLISFLRDFDVKGIRKLSVLLPKWIMPDPLRVGKYILNTNDDIKLIIDPSIDKGVELSLHETGTYEKGVLNFIRREFKGTGAFVDVGANIGLMSLYVSKYFPERAVEAFEAHPETFKILSKNVALNDASNVKTHQLAVGEANGSVEIFDNFNVNRGGASIIIHEESSASYAVDQVTLDEVFKSDVVSMIKIDVEGYELNVLQGAIHTINRDRPTLIVEISQNRLQDDQTGEIFKFILELHLYKIFKLKGSKERKSALIEINDVTELPEHDNIICIPH